MNGYKGQWKTFVKDCLTTELEQDHFADVGKMIDNQAVDAFET